MPLPLLALDGLSVALATASGRTTVLDRLSFAIRAGKTLALVGESGCGKTLTALSLLGLLEPPFFLRGGRIVFDGEQLSDAPAAVWQRLRGNALSMVFQNPQSALNPLMRVGEQVAEPLRVHRGLSRIEAMERAIEMLHELGIQNARARARDYPHQLSGGMCQRVVIAMALICGPKLLVADEPTTALDPTVQMQILDLLRRQQRARNMSVLFVSHDLRVIEAIADDVAIMYAGRIVEKNATEQIMRRPRHPYTHALWLAAARTAREPGRSMPILGQPPPIGAKLAGCAFAPRCCRRRDRCLREVPPMRGGVACFEPLETAADCSDDFDEVPPDVGLAR